MIEDRINGIRKRHAAALAEDNDNGATCRDCDIQILLQHVDELETKIRTEKELTHKRIIVEYVREDK
jgi:hypothetical protein